MVVFFSKLLIAEELLEIELIWLFKISTKDLLSKLSKFTFKFSNKISLLAKDQAVGVFPISNFGFFISKFKITLFFSK